MKKFALSLLTAMAVYAVIGIAVPPDNGPVDPTLPETAPVEEA